MTGPKQVLKAQTGYMKNIFPIGSTCITIPSTLKYVLIAIYSTSYDGLTEEEKTCLVYRRLYMLYKYHPEAESNIKP